jgi:hypothetical protein
MQYVLFSVSSAILNFYSGMINDYPIEVLRYAVVCYDKDLLDDAARVAIAKPLDTVVLGLSPKIAIAWVTAQSVNFDFPDPFHDIRSNIFRNGVTH